MIARIRDRDAFVRLRREGVRHRTASMWCAFVDDPSITPPQVAFSIGRDVGPAVTRNRLRRRLRAILTSQDVPNGLLLFGVRPTSTELTFEDLQTRTAALLDAAHGRGAVS